MAKMLSHEYLSNSDDSSAISLIRRKSFIGTFVSTNSNWVGTLKNKNWLNDEESERLFQWRLNVASCLSLVGTLRSCTRRYIRGARARVVAERQLAGECANDLFEGGVKIQSFNDLEHEIEDYEYRVLRQGKRISECISGDSSAFTMDLFVPFQRIIGHLKRAIKFPPNATWVLCIDEAEFLSEMHHRILNSFIRSDTKGLFLKITTLPYAHYTPDTNIGVPALNIDDFEYVYIDSVFNTSNDAANKKKASKFVEEVFAKRIRGTEHEESGLKLEYFLGHSELLRTAVRQEKVDPEKIMPLIRRFCDERTVNRAQELYGTPRFSNEISRKLSGVLFLRESISRRRGRQALGVFSGYEVLVACTDGNPRRIISMLNKLFLGAEQKRAAGFMPASPTLQNEAFESAAETLLQKSKADSVESMTLYDLLNLIGSEFRSRIHDRKISTDTYGSVTIGRSEAWVWELIVAAVQMGLLYPIVKSNNRDELPYRSGTFRLAYAVAPKFQLLPRKGRPIPLSTILLGGSIARTQLSSEAHVQISLQYESDAK